MLMHYSLTKTLGDNINSYKSVEDNLSILLFLLALLQENKALPVMIKLVTDVKKI